MPAIRRAIFRTSLALTAGSALAVAPLVTLPASAAPDGTGVVISEAYLNGGSTGATYRYKFVELHNPTEAAISLDGTSLQYRPYSSVTAASAVALTGSIPAGGYYLIRGAANSTAGEDFTTTIVPDAVSGTSWAGNANGGTLVLADTTAPLTLPAGDTSANADVIDALGYTASNTFETAVAAGQPSVTTSFQRTDGADSNSNAADFALGAVTAPRNTSYDPDAEPEEPEEPEVPEPVAATIPEIQGTTDTSPLAGTTVVTEGVVTATYPTGGFNGYWIQTPGTGGDLDLATHTASEAVFVYSPATVASVEIGDFVEVTGPVSEFNGLTEITVGTAAGLTPLDSATVDPVTPASVPWSTSAAVTESLEGMLLAPQGDFTVTNTYSLNQYASIGLASGTSPLITPTEITEPGSAEYTALVAENASKLVTLDDGASINFLGGTTNKAIPLPYLTVAEPIRVGASVEFTGPVILDYRNGGWNFQPVTQLTTANAETIQPVAFENTREDAPKDVGGDITIAGFNVLNYFTTTGDAGTCTFYNDRDGNPVTVNSCSGSIDVRGAANATSLSRQQAKIVTAINTLDADVVGLEEIENSARAGKNRDAALSTLVDALNADAGSAVWSFAASPSALPTDEDVIRTAFIYRNAAVRTVGDSVILTGSAAFSNAREPLAQAFALADDTEGDTTFLAIANHFKSKGSGEGPGNTDIGDGQGASNASRVAQATALVDFADTVSNQVGTNKVFLLGDFNAYSKEDPIDVLVEAGYVDQGAKTGKHTYSFSGTSGSLDHILASGPADEAVADVDIWNINAAESIALEYSRFNYNATDFYDESPFRSSDHDPIVVGVDLAKAPEEPQPVATTTKLTLSKSSTGFGKAVKASATVSGAKSGVVSFRYGSTTTRVKLSGGKATLALPATLKAGRHSIKATFTGTSTAKPSTSKTLTLTVAKAVVKVKTSVKSKVAKGSRLKVTGAVTAYANGRYPTGTVQVKVGGKTVTTVKLGAKGAYKATLPKSVTKTSKKSIRVSVKYTGTSNIKAATGRTKTVRIR